MCFSSWICVCTLVVDTMMYYLLQREWFHDLLLFVKKYPKETASGFILSKNRHVWS